jgi:class 3 adenylate cyclase/ActR/RegA family two-component response regulator
MTTLGDSMVKVLVIDESEVITTGLKIKLERAGFEVYVAHDVEMVYYYIDELFIDFFAVIMEVDMPNIKSHDKFVEYMTGKLITTILLSAISDNEFISKMLKHDVVDYIIKSREEDLIYAVDMVQRLNVYKEHTVLVIDDSKIAQRTTKKNLEILKFKVLLADDGLLGLEAFKKHPEVKLILTDYNMPNMNGFDLILNLRKEYTREELIIVAVTAADDPKTTSMFLKYGANGYVSKKTTKEELNYTINNLMDVLAHKEEATRVKKEIEEYTTQLSKYVSPQIYDSIVNDEGGDDAVATKDKKLTIFFSDIAGFTKTTESLESEELTEMLNTYLTEMSDIALKWGATIDKFIGDAVMIFFGDPQSDGVAQDAYKCVMMAVEMQNRLESFREEQRAKGVLLPFHIRCGIATGSVTVGNFGSEDRMDYTIIGRFVHLAEHLEASAPHDEVMISEETYLYVKDKIDVIPSSKIELRGFSSKIQPYVVVKKMSEEEVSDAANITLKAVLDNMNRKSIVLDFKTKKLVAEIDGINDEKVEE